MRSDSHAPHPRVLFLAPVEPWCRESGSSLIIADLLHGLARQRGAEILSIFLRRSPVVCGATAPVGLSTSCLGVALLAKWESVARSLVKRSTPMRYRFDNGDVVRRVEAELRDRKFVPTVVHVEHLPLVDIGAAL